MLKTARQDVANCSVIVILLLLHACIDSWQANHSMWTKRWPSKEYFQHEILNCLLQCPRSREPDVPKVEQYLGNMYFYWCRPILLRPAIKNLVLRDARIKHSQVAETRGEEIPPRVLCSWKISIDQRRRCCEEGPIALILCACANAIVTDAEEFDCATKHKAPI